MVAQENREQLTQILISYHDDLQSLEDTLIDIEHLLCPKEDKSLEGRKQAFIEELRPYVDEVGKEVANKFVNYWLEISPKGKKYRFEKEKVFSMKQRLNTWVANQKKFSIVNMIKQRQ